MRRPICLVPLLMAGLCQFALAEDWPQWRGPQRNGLATQSPPLVDGFPKEGPKLLWESEKLFEKGKGGWGSVVVADGRAYVYANVRIEAPVETRTLGSTALRNMGYSARTMPAELLAAVEKTRLSDERAAVPRKEAWKWCVAWADKHAGSGELLRFHTVIVYRLYRGRKMIPDDVLNKLATIANKPFESEAKAQAWFKENGLEKYLFLVKYQFTKTETQAVDRVLCLDARTGKTLWKYTQPGSTKGNPGSSTPCIDNGRCYVQGTRGYVYCLDAVSGKEIWRVLTKKPKNHAHWLSAGSFVVADGIPVVMSEFLTGFDPADGSVLWVRKEITHPHTSPTSYTSGGKTYVVCNGKKETFCVDPKDGRVLWQVPGGQTATPAIADDWMIIVRMGTQPGTLAYRLSPGGATKAWEHEFTDRGVSALIHRDAVYLIGGHGTPNDKGTPKIVCLDLAAGKLNWEAVGKRDWRSGPFDAEYSSPIGVGDKIVAVVGVYDKGSLMLFKADTQRHVVLGHSLLEVLPCTSPALADGIVYLRMKNSVAAYDLRKSGP